MNFYINKGATLPMVILELIQDGRNDYKKFHEKVQNADITFTMTDIDTGIKKIGCKPAVCLCKTCEGNNDCDEEQYYVAYQFTEKETYILQAKVKNAYGLESNWGQLSISIPRNIMMKNLNFFRAMEIFLNAFYYAKNLL